MYELKKNTKNVILVMMGILLVLLDQFVKYKIRLNSGFYICNENLAFNLSPLSFFFILLGFIVILLVSNFKFQILNLKSISDFKFQISNFNTLTVFSVSLILSGALSNIIDRLHFGCVTDFIDLRFWPVFNFADIYITIGVTAIIIKNIFRTTDSH